MSDRHRGRWGRRIPFLLIPTPIIVLSVVGLAFSPLLGRHLHSALGASSPTHDVFRINAGEFVGDRLPQWQYPVVNP